ncbi:hypothetical protein, partial [Mesorhizobium sp. B2-8-3]|uniref:hypothetical protein n=1 Tax=Mesorhizobium sp. B2-8-3 TaxID=2589905 RepID=UPI001AED47B3
QHESFHQKLESRPSQDGNPEYQQTLDAEIPKRRVVRALHQQYIGRAAWRSIRLRGSAVESFESR